jgi:glycerophosphoryl diester phosphodiesterase
VVVIAHDRHLNPDITRDAAGRWIDPPGPTVRSLTFAELQGYDVGRIKPGIDYARRYPEQRAVDGTRMPRLLDLIQLVRKSGNQAVRLNIETKISPMEPEETVDPETFARAVVEYAPENMQSRTPSGRSIMYAARGAEARPRRRDLLPDRSRNAG